MLTACLFVDRIIDVFYKRGNFMKLRKVTALIAALVMVFAFSACKAGGGDENTTLSPLSDNTQAVTTDSALQEGDDKSDLPAEAQTRVNGETVRQPIKEKTDKGFSADKPTDAKGGLNSTDTKTVLEYYKAAARNTETIDAAQYMSIGSIDFTPRNSVEKGLFTFFNTIASAALSAHSTPRHDVPGNHQELESSDLNSANAIVSGPYTIVTLNVKTQEDNEDATESSVGPVGHAVGTIGDFNQVYEALPSIKVDHSRGDIALRYDNCKVVVKINNNTGKIETGIWSYTVNVSLTDIYTVFPGSEELNLNGIGGSVIFDVRTNDQKK